MLWVWISVAILVAALTVFTIFGASFLAEHIRGRNRSPSNRTEPMIADKRP